MPTQPAAADVSVNRQTTPLSVPDTPGRRIGVPWLIAGSTAVLVVGLGLLAMWGLGLFEQSASDPNANALAASIALVGVIVGASTTMVGTMVKFAIDDRNNQLAALESSRNYLLAKEAEQRNRIQAAISAVDLLGENNLDASPAQMNGAVLALVSLGELELAVALLGLLWPQDKLTDEVADVVLRKSLIEGTDETLKSASAALFSNAERINQGDHHIWPISQDWRSDVSLGARIGLVGAAARWLEASLVEFPTMKPSAPVAVLYHALEDPHDVIRGVAGESLRPFVGAAPEDYWAATSHGGKISLQEIRTRVEACEPEWTTTRLSIDSEQRVTAALRANSALSHDGH